MGSSRTKAPKAKSSGSGEALTDKESGAKPVPKFKKRKAAEAAGLALEDDASPFAGRAKKLGSEITRGEGSAEPTSELAKLRAAKKAAQEEREAEEKAAAEAAEAAALAARPLPLVLVENLLKLVQAIISTLVSLLRQLLMPSDVRFD